MTGDRQHISSGSPYELVAGFCRAVRVGDRVFIAGTAPISSDGMVDPDPEAQTRRCLEIIGAAMREAGGSLNDIVRTRVFVTDRKHFDAVARVHGETFASVRPANTTVVCQLLDEAWKVEIEAEAVLPLSVKLV